VAPEPGYTIAFASFAPLNTDIFVADANGRDPKPHNASFSSDGKWIVFTSQREGTADIYRVHPDGSGLKRLVADPAFDDQGSLSPNGKFLAFVSSRSGQADIWVLELATRKPPDGATYILNQPVSANYGCTDSLSGADTCAGPVVNGSNIDTAGLGAKSFTINATDRAGNRAMKSNSYSVVQAQYVFIGFLAPVDNLPTVNTGKAGRTYPVKWQLRDSNGAYVSS